MVSGTDSSPTGYPAVAPIETAVRGESPAGTGVPLLAVLVPAEGLPHSLNALDQQTGGLLSRVVASGDFRGKPDETALLYCPGPAERVLLLGVGPGAQVDAARIRRAAATAAKRARLIGVGSAALYLPFELCQPVGARVAGQAAAEGVIQGAWYFGEMKRPPEAPRPRLDRVDLLAPEETAEFTAGHAVGVAIGAGQTFTRNLQMLPGNLCTPSFLAQRAEELAGRYGFESRIFDRAALVKEGMGALLAVAQGSAEEPRLIVLEYRGAEGAPVVLVGKGVTFDTGGISIKPAQNMEDMKYDMSGAAAVLGTFEMLGRLRPAVHVVGLVPSAENMPGGAAYRPGDVIHSHFGKTIEVVNTDAEGRLLLCDTLSYARRYQPDCVLDAATLTGAVVIALGHTATGVMGNDEPLIAEVREAGERAGEPVWPLPLWEEYRELLKSDIADVKNSGGRPAGTITAGWFLREFVEGYRWAHLDIAGTAYSDREDATRTRGPTGVGVRLFSEFVLGRAR